MYESGFPLSFFISIHAPARGATRYGTKLDPTNKFQSTLPRGERLISSFVTLNFPLFQSTLPRGERPQWQYSWEKLQKFQSTLPRGERHPNRLPPPLSREFQSTLPRGERQLRALGFEEVDYISIHAPARGATMVMIGDSLTN